MRFYSLGKKQVSVVRINGVEFREDVWTFPRDKENCP